MIECIEHAGRIKTTYKNQIGRSPNPEPFTVIEQIEWKSGAISSKSYSPFLAPAKGRVHPASVGLPLSATAFDFFHQQLLVKIRIVQCLNSTKGTWQRLHKRWKSPTCRTDL